MRAESDQGRSIDLAMASEEGVLERVARVVVVVAVGGEGGGVGRWWPREPRETGMAPKTRDVATKRVGPPLPVGILRVYAQFKALANWPQPQWNFYGFLVLFFLKKNKIVMLKNI